MLQVKYRPYMSMSERNDVVKEFERRAQEGGTCYQAILVAVLRVEGVAARRGMRKRQRALGPPSSAPSALTRRRLAAQRYFFNYNTVESVLLACSVLINLAGIMFESGRLDTKSQRVQREFLTYSVLLIIASSFVYSSFVFVSEIVTTFYPEGICKKPKKVKPTARRPIKGADASVSEVEPAI